MPDGRVDQGNADAAVFAAEFESSEGAEDVIGGRSPDERFARFLANWQLFLARRVEAAVAEFSSVPGVCGLILAGGIGRGAPWPLSDIDLLPIYDDRHAEAAAAELERRRLALLGPWIAEGWWTGLDVGKLDFRRSDVARVLAETTLEPSALLGDDRWYYALDKGYGGRALHDPAGLAGELATWFTRHRFDAAVVQFRLARERQEIVIAQRNLRDCLAAQDFCDGTVQLRAAVKWLQTWLLEHWGERDNSLGRIGTRFASLARARGPDDLVDELDVLSDLGDASVARRMAEAPDWVHERHDRSLRARRHAGEVVTRLQDARDTLRVSALYAMRYGPSPPYPAWLAIPATTDTLQGKAMRLEALVLRVFTALP